MTHGEMVEVRDRRGMARSRLKVTNTVASGCIFMPMHDVQVNRLTLEHVDPYSRQPSYKDAAVSPSCPSKELAHECPYEFSKEQQAYLQGLVMGSDVARKIKNLPVLSGSASSGNGSPASHITVGGGHLPSIHAEAQQRFEAAGKTLVAEEKAKRDKNGLAMWSEMETRSAANEYPKGTDVFMTKFQGLFFVAPAQQSYMCRMRIPGGELRSDQVEGIADLSDRFANGRLDLTTRANLQLREIESKHAMEILMGLRDLGIVTLGSGADNVRNNTASAGGIDPCEWIRTCHWLASYIIRILNKPELYGLPRKFNIAFDGGGQISSLAETSDVSFHAVRVSHATE
ncbi:MAG: molybdopterin dinucleotide binding domain-containing protein [Pirellulales bacterium]